MKGRYPDILNDPVKGPESKKLFADAQAMLTQDRRAEMAHRQRRRG